MLSGCSLNSVNYSWFRDQGINLTECAPAATGNILRWYGINVDNSTLRNHYITPSWWSFNEIKSILYIYNIDYLYINSTLSNINNLQYNEMALFYINNNHFIVVNKINNNFIVYDSLMGIYNKTVYNLYNSISTTNNGKKYGFIKITK